MTSATAKTETTVRLGLGPNLAQFSLLVVVNASSSPCARPVAAAPSGRRKPCASAAWIASDPSAACRDGRNS